MAEAEARVDEQILACVRSIPRGRVMTYGDVAEYVGSNAPRQVGRVLSEYGDTDSDDVLDDSPHWQPLPWHRVLRADGRCAPHLFLRQRALLLLEGVPFRGDRVLLRECRWDGVSPG
ncbi:O(6)-alkylguanine repair protein YbaZ [Jatrophihabitans sp. GAS493]|uniref:MGMT family protein n=1 Tax=Jatrophihabitans sp. GAS493 TaxID=1907575 RepID=UPI000BBFA15A|nr:MGMT family protein [Jatrophihabitans sp. GAS493]SOD73177.1 O(6)-alkylguanine repair protein YbaZ [Jatrophihabitans sp. GAS493]